MRNKLIALFVEGATELEFYKAVIKHARSKMNTPYYCSIEYVDMKGIGNYKKDALRKFRNLQKKYKTMDIHVFLCIDSDVFEFSKKPPINKTEVANGLKEAGAKKVQYIVAKSSIEEWFLCDYEGVLRYLHLPTSTKRPPGNGQKVLKILFKNATKVYVKGGKTEGFIDNLNISNIVKANCKILKPLCTTLELDCHKVCN